MPLAVLKMNRSKTLVIWIFTVLSVASSGYGFCRNIQHQKHINTVRIVKNFPGSTTSYRLSMSKEDDDNAVSRRRKRRGKDGAGSGTTISSPNAADLDVSRERVVITPDGYTTEAMVAPAGGDGTTSLEDSFGLGNNQLRELMEQELPVPREDLVTKKEVKETDGNKVFKLPELKEFLDSVTGETGEKNRQDAEERMKKIDRSNQEEYLRVIQLNPFADADDTMFLDEVCIPSYTKLSYVQLYKSNVFRSNIYQSVHA